MLDVENRIGVGEFTMVRGSLGFQNPGNLSRVLSPHRWDGRSVRYAVKRMVGSIQEPVYCALRI